MRAAKRPYFVQDLSFFSSGILEREANAKSHKD